jgi:membrane-bound ClpP family serine protease
MFEKIRVVPLALKYWAFFQSTMICITLVFVSFLFVPSSFQAPILLVIVGFVLIVLSDSIIMDGIGDSSSAGYDETVTGGTFIAPDPLSESSPHSFFGTDSFSFT